MDTVLSPLAADEDGVRFPAAARSARHFGVDVGPHDVAKDIFAAEPAVWVHRSAFWVVAGTRPVDAARVCGRATSERLGTDAVAADDAVAGTEEMEPRSSRAGGLGRFVESPGESSAGARRL